MIFFKFLSTFLTTFHRICSFTSTADKVSNKYYLGPAPLEEMARQIATAFGPCGNNRDYLFLLEKAMFDIGKTTSYTFRASMILKFDLSGVKLSTETLNNRSWGWLCYRVGQWSEKSAWNCWTRDSQGEKVKWVNPHCSEKIPYSSPATPSSPGSHCHRFVGVQAWHLRRKERTTHKA